MQSFETSLKKELLELKGKMLYHEQRAMDYEVRRIQLKERLLELETEEENEK